MAKNGPPRGGFGIRRPDRINRAHDGTQERDTKNDHSTCWTLQVAAFAQFIGDSKMLALTADRFTKIYLPNQRAPMAASPLKMARIKPYGYSLFNLETMSTLAKIHNL